MRGLARSCRLISLSVISSASVAWVSPRHNHHSFRPETALKSAPAETSGSLHGQNACFLPLNQLDQEYYAPRIIQIAGAYPGLTRQEFFAVTSEPPAELGQWTYDFSDPDGPQLGTVALDGSSIVHSCEDPVVIIAEHLSLGLSLPKEIVDPVDLVVLVDRAKSSFLERSFLVIDTPGKGIAIAAFNTVAEVPEGSDILGQVALVQVPWLPSMAPTKTGFMESDEYF